MSLDNVWAESELLSVHYSAAAAVCSLSMSSSEGSFLLAMAFSSTSFSSDWSRELTVPFSLTLSFSGVFSLESSFASTSLAGDSSFTSEVSPFSTDFCRSVDVSFSGPSSLAGVGSLDVLSAGVASLEADFSFSSSPLLDSASLSCEFSFDCFPTSPFCFSWKCVKWCLAVFQ